MRHVFGPVPSRRLGQSLGVDPIVFKTCNWNCVYCQLGRSTPMSRERKEYVPTNDVVAEIRQALREHGPGEIDWITFGGSGEPTLHSGLGTMIRAVKEMTSIPVAVLTNGSLLYLPEVQVDLMPADAVLPTLDAGTDEVYQQVNRPRPELIFERLVGGLQSFRRVYGGKLWVEVMLVKGLNDGEEALRDLAAVLARIRPDEVHVNRPVRPPAEGWVSVPDEEALARAAAILGQGARVVRGAGGVLDLSGHGDLHEAVIEILARHPMSADELTEALGRWSPGEVDAALAQLAETRRVRPVERMGLRFWVSSEGRYGADGGSFTRRTPPGSPSETPPHSGG
jgi:wyosine [tRNA(Phe)-imidazoG37] synthetase (radical SAM superfamily)